MLTNFYSICPTVNCINLQHNNYLAASPTYCCYTTLGNKSTAYSRITNSTKVIHYRCTK